MRKPIEEMDRHDELMEFGIVSPSIIALHCDWHNEDKKRDVFRAIRAYADRQNEALIKEISALRPRPMSEMKDEYRDGRFVLMWLLGGYPVEGAEPCVCWYWPEKQVWLGAGAQKNDAYFTHFMLIPEME